MSDLNTTTCGCNCGCDKQEKQFCISNSCLWMILLFFCCNQKGALSNTGCGDNCMWIILLLCCCGGLGAPNKCLC